MIQYRLWLSCIDISNIVLDISMFWPQHYILCVLFYDWCCGCMPVLQFCNCLVGIKHDGFGKKALSTHLQKSVILYHAIYRCIVIQKRWYIDTLKMCIVAYLYCAYIIFKANMKYSLLKHLPNTVDYIIVSNCLF